MHFILIAQMALACLAAASPSRRQSENNLLIQLEGRDGSNKETYETSTDYNPLWIDSISVFRKITISCTQVCIEYHCEVWDKAGDLILNANPGETAFDTGVKINQIRCTTGLAEDKSGSTETTPPGSGYKGRRNMES